MFTMGSLLWAVPLWRNSLVFHDVDKVRRSRFGFPPPLPDLVALIFPNARTEYSVSIVWYWRHRSYPRPCKLFVGT